MKYVCRHCFNDVELIGFIQSRDIIGRCHFCGKDDAEIIETTELLEFFKQLLDNFKVDKKGENIISIIQKYWRFFKSEEVGKEILNFVLKQVQTSITRSDEKVTFSNEILENVNYWEILKEQLKWERRYITNIEYLTEDLGWDGFFNSKSTIKPNNTYYRARLHYNANERKYNKTSMLSPARELATAGRANPPGIPYLYLCDNKETVLYEIRAAYLDEVTIAYFKLNQISNDPVIISDFTEIPSLFFTNAKESEITNQIKSTLLKQKISKDLSRPLRRYDSDLDYIPTQFICEFIRIFTNVGGIKFRSSLHKSGNNIVIFDQNKMQCINRQKVKITNVNIKSKEIEY